MENLQILVVVLEFILQSTSVPSPHTKIFYVGSLHAPHSFLVGGKSRGLFTKKGLFVRVLRALAGEASCALCLLAALFFFFLFFRFYSMPCLIGF